MKNVLVLVHDDPGQRARFAAAIDLTRALGGRLHCLGVTLISKAAVVSYADFGVELLPDGEREQEASNKKRLAQKLGELNIPWTWSDVEAGLEDALLEEALLSDVIVISQQLTGSPYPDMQRLAGHLIVKSYRPIVVVPQCAGGLDVFGRALVAWNGSESSSAAMIAAVPLLRHAAQVILLEIEDDCTEAPVEEAAAYLDGCGIKARIVKQALLGQSVDDMLLHAIENLAATYVVMGGYGHARLVERIFGGAAQTLLGKSSVPVFLAH